MASTEWWQRNGRLVWDFYGVPDATDDETLRRFADESREAREGKDLAETLDRFLNHNSPTSPAARGFQNGLCSMHPTLLGKLWNAVALAVESREGDGRVEGITSREAHLVRQPFV